MTITREKVIEFFEDRCSADEAEAVYAYLQEHPEWVAEHFPEEEWRDFEPGSQTQEQPGTRIWGGVAAGTGVTVRDIGEPGKLRALVYRLRYVGVAAAVAIAIGTGIFFSWRSWSPGRETAARRQEPKRKDIFLYNGAMRMIRDTLADGSVVELFPGSSVTIDGRFGERTRDIRLEGEALFRVAHSPRRPFTVFAAGLATTALGTVFRVSVYEGHGMPTVRLLEGTVIVKCVAHPQLSALLSPGERCTFDVAANSFHKTKTSPAMPKVAPDLTNMDEGSYEESDDALVFKNMALPKVLHILSLTYHIPILYRDAELRKRMFTGNIDKQRSLDTALSTISELNDIVIERQDDGSFRVHLHP